MTRVRDVFATRMGIIIVGLVLGGIAASLQKLGNPENMGVCVACFTRDVAGALGLHRAGIVQYLRPEIPAFCLGAFAAALVFGEFRPRTGSAPIQRFLLGMFAIIGALVFLGCPWRAMLRLAGGDWNAILGIIGLVAGIAVGVWFLRIGFSLGRSHPARLPVGLATPLVMVVLLLLAIFSFQAGEGAALFRSKSGPGAQAAPIIVSIAAGLIIGFLAQRTRFCTVGGIRDVILMRDTHLLSGLLAFLIAAFVMNLIYGQFHPGFMRTAADGAAVSQPAAHTEHWLNFGGMALAGLSFCLAGGCPGRQIFLSGEGDGDAAMFFFGMLTGAALAHNFLMVGTQPLAPWAVILGLIIVFIIGLTGRSRPALAR
ncbi:MAG: YedE family putative selenium transporter [Planctomycetota bacterium]|nr:YedE family putative selenium transporter [Planctomycetota bacterium]